MSENRISLKESIERIGKKLPYSLPTGITLTELIVTPINLEKVVNEELSICKGFISWIESMEDSIEKDIPGITSFFQLTIENKDSPLTVAISGIASSVKFSGDYLGSVDTQEIKVFERVGNVMLYKGRKLSHEELITFYTAISIIDKVKKLKLEAMQCLSTLGSIRTAIDIGTLYNRRIEIVYFGDYNLSTEVTPVEELSLKELLPILAKIFVMKTLPTLDKETIT